MIKQKLKEIREKRFSQDDFAIKLGIDPSMYNRRENGVTKISKREWDAMAKVLEVKLEDIYEPEDGIYVINNENANGEYSGSHNVFNNHTDFVFETMKKYIENLEGEVKDKKQTIAALQEKTAQLEKQLAFKN